MAPESQSNVVLMSIKPKYANAIFEGTKRVEFRKQPFKRPVSHVIVYSSSEDKRILGYFTLGETDVGNPRTLWKRYRRVGAIKYADYEAYFGTRNLGVAFHVEEVCPLAKPISLSRLKRNLKAPQSYCYIPEKYLTKLRKLTGEGSVL